MWLAGTQGVKQSDSDGEERASEAQMDNPSFIDEARSSQALFCWLPPPVAPDGSTWLLKINHLPWEKSGEKKRSGNGGGKGFLCSASLRDVCQSGIAGMPGRDPCRGGGNGQLPPQQPCRISSWLLLLTAGSGLAVSRRKLVYGNRFAG